MMTSTNSFSNLDLSLFSIRTARRIITWDWIVPEEVPNLNHEAPTGLETENEHEPVIPEEVDHAA